jgi:hypothetical protein
LNQDFYFPVIQSPVGTNRRELPGLTDRVPVSVAYDSPEDFAILAKMRSTDEQLSSALPLASDEPDLLDISQFCNRPFEVLEGVECGKRPK